MNILIIEIEEMIINNNNIDIEIKKNKYFINILFMIDLLYNIIIYKKYEIELLFEKISWNQDINYEYYKILEFDEIEYNIKRNQRINQKYINK